MNRSRTCFAFLVTAATLAGAGVRPARADSPPPNDDAMLLGPTQGRPLFVEPGGTFAAHVQMPAVPHEVTAELVSRRVPSHRHPLTAQTVAAGEPPPIVRFMLRVPSETPEQTYDLEIRTDAGRLAARHAVAVARLGSRIRLVHLSNMNIGASAAPRFDRRLVEEVNLIAPTLIVATGDLLDAAHGDPEAGWQALGDYLAEFDAPVLVACGDHDDLYHFSRTLAPSPVGTLDVGPYRGLVLYDTPARPVSQDPDQIGWIEAQLARPGPTMHFMLSHDECPSLLSYWQERGALNTHVRAGRVGVWFAGGSRDWDGQEYRTLIDAAAPLLYVRTHQSSPATRGGASGVSHYRVLDLDGQQAIVYGAAAEAGPLPRSIPVGHLRQQLSGPNDGREDRLEFEVASALPFRLDHLRRRVLLAKAGDERPWSHGAEITRLVDRGAMWECWLALDLPDNGTVRCAVGTGPAPEEPRVGVTVDLPQRLRLAPPAESAGGEYRLAADEPGVVHLRNESAQSVRVEPLVRLDGEPVAYRVVDTRGPFASAYELRLAPHQALTLQLDLSAVRVRPGRRELQIYLQGGLTQVPVCWPLDLLPAE